MKKLLKYCDYLREEPTFNLENIISLKTRLYVGSFKKYLLIGTMGDTKTTPTQILPIRSLQSSRGDRTHTWDTWSELCFSKMNLILCIR